VLEDGQRSPSTWRVWSGRRSLDIYIASRHIPVVKMSLHQSGHWKTSVDGPDVPIGLKPGEYLDKWAKPADIHPGIVHGFTIFMPWSQLLAWPSVDEKPDTLRLHMEPFSAAAVDLFLTRPTLNPTPMHLGPSAVFARFALPDDHEAILVSRKVPWSLLDDIRLAHMKANARDAQRAYVDPRPPKPVAEPAIHMTRLTTFGVTVDGHRFAVDAYDAQPFAGHPRDTRDTRGTRSDGKDR
jgi:hypothetical protein